MYDSDESITPNTIVEDCSDEPPLLPIRTNNLYALDSDDDSSVDSEMSEDILHHQSLDRCIDDKYFKGKDVMSISQIIRGQTTRPKKRQKTQDLRPVVYVRFNARKGKPKPVTLVALLDSGASSTLITEKYTKKLKLKQTNKGNVWTTPAGNLKTSKSCRTQITIPEFYDNRLIEWEFHVTKSMGAYDMIIGRDMLDDLGFILNFDEHVVTWEHASVPFKDMENDIFE